VVVDAPVGEEVEPELQEPSCLGVREAWTQSRERNAPPIANVQAAADGVDAQGDPDVEAAVAKAEQHLRNARAGLRAGDFGYANGQNALARQALEGIYVSRLRRLVDDDPVAVLLLDRADELREKAAWAGRQGGFDVSAAYGAVASAKLLEVAVSPLRACVRGDVPTLREGPLQLLRLLFDRFDERAEQLDRKVRVHPYDVEADVVLPLVAVFEEEARLIHFFMELAIDQPEFAVMSTAAEGQAITWDLPLYTYEGAQAQADVGAGPLVLAVSTTDTEGWELSELTAGRWAHVEAVVALLDEHGTVKEDRYRSTHYTLARWTSALASARANAFYGDGELAGESLAGARAFRLLTAINRPAEALHLAAGGDP